MSTPEIKASTPLKKEAYAQIQAGAYSPTAGKAKLNVGALLGGEISKNGTYANAEVGLGSSFSASVKVGHEFNIGKNMGLELSANGEYLRNNFESTFKSHMEINSPNWQEQAGLKTTWHDGYKKAGAGLSLNFNGEKGNIKIGVEGGYSTNNTPQITHQYDAQKTQNATIQTTAQDVNITSVQNKTVKMSYNGHQAGAYITPTISAELNLGKSGHWSAVMDADRFQGNAGIRYTF